MAASFLDRFQVECDAHLNSELHTRLLASLSNKTTASVALEYYLTEYKRCIDEQKNFVAFINEQMISLETLKTCETSLDAFLERLKIVHEFEMKQNEVFEQILHELTKMNSSIHSSKDERIRLLTQIDELIAYKAKLTGSTLSTGKLSVNTSDTFKNLL